MKHPFRTLLPALSLLLFVPGTSLAAGDNFSISLDGQYSRRLSGTTGHNNALGGALLFEWQPVPELSLGLGTEYNNYFGVAPTTADPSMASSINLLEDPSLGPFPGFFPFLLGARATTPRSGTTPGWGRDTPSRGLGPGVP